MFQITAGHTFPESGEMDVTTVEYVDKRDSHTRRYKNGESKSSYRQMYVFRTSGQPSDLVSRTYDWSIRRTIDQSEIWATGTEHMQW